MAVTLKEVARLAGASVASVSATLNGSSGKNIRVGRQTRERIRVAATQLGYVSNPIAKSLATGRTRVLGLMLPYANAFVDQNPFCGQVLTGIMKEVVHDHYNVMVYTAAEDMASSQAAMMIDSRVDGVLLVMPKPDSAAFLKCESRNIPYVSILRDPVPGAWTVNADDEEGGRLGTEHLIRLGHRRIAHLVGSPEVTTSLPRLRGYRRAMAAAGIEVDESLIVPASFDWREGYDATIRLLRLPPPKRPTAVFAANDLCAEGALRATREIGMTVPDDVALVGFDDTWFSTMTQPALTTVRMPIEEMGVLAAQLLVSRIEGREITDRQLVLPVSLTVRSSCGAKPPV